jgi:hypothetical protein
MTLEVPQCYPTSSLRLISIARNVRCSSRPETQDAGSCELSSSLLKVVPIYEQQLRASQGCLSLDYHYAGKPSKAQAACCPSGDSAGLSVISWRELEQSGERQIRLENPNSAQGLGCISRSSFAFLLGGSCRYTACVNGIRHGRVAACSLTRPAGKKQP